MKIALIAGASGLVGSELLKILTESNEYKTIHVLTRKSLNHNSPKIVEHLIQFDEIANLKLEAPIDHIFCTLGTTIKKAGTKENFHKVDFEYVVELGKKAKLWNAEKFLVVSSLGANAQSAIFYSRIKGEMEKALQEINLPHLFIFRPSLLMGNRKENRTGEKTAIAVYKIINPLFIGKLKKYKGIESRRVAQAMMKTAMNDSSPLKIIESDEIQQF